MAEGLRYCANCGTPLVIQDGKIVCPNCGTEYAIDWGREDVARAKIETEQARNQAQLERDRVISQTREQIHVQQSYNSKRRERQRSGQNIENRLIRVGIIVASIFMIIFMFRACVLVVSLNSGSISNALFGEDISSRQSEVEKTVKIEEELLLEDEDLLKNVYAAQVYLVKNLTAREIIPEGKDTKYIFTGNFEFEEGYLIYMDTGRTELFEIFSLEYASEDGSDSVIVYVPVYTGMNGVSDGNNIKISCRFEAHQYKGSHNSQGYTDKDMIIDKYTAKWDSITEVVRFDIPADIRSAALED